MPPKKAAAGAAGKSKGKGGGTVAPGAGGGKKKKKKGSGGSGSSGASTAPVAGPPEDPVTAARRRALIERAVALRGEADREIQAAAELRQGVARVEEAWAAGTKALAEADTSLGAATASSGGLGLDHEEALVTRRQGLRHAMQEQLEELVQRKIEAHAELEAAQEAQRAEDDAHWLEYREAKVALKAREVEQAAARLQTHKAFAAAEGALREEYEGKVGAAQAEHEARMEALRAQAAREREAGLAALEAKKAARLEATKAAHALELADLKTRYNVTIEAQRQRLDGLKAKVGEVRRRVRQDEQRLLGLRGEKAARAGPLARAAEGLEAWEAAVAALEEEKAQLRSLEARVQEEDRAVRALGRDGEGLRRRLEQARAEAASLRERTQVAVLRAQQRSAFGVLLLENRLRRLQARVEAHRRAAAARAEAEATAAPAAWVGAGVVVVVVGEKAAAAGTL